LLHRKVHGEDAESVAPKATPLPLPLRLMEGSSYLLDLKSMCNIWDGQLSKFGLLDTINVNDAWINTMMDKGALNASDGTQLLHTIGTWAMSKAGMDFNEQKNVLKQLEWTYAQMHKAIARAIFCRFQHDDLASVGFRENLWPHTLFLCNFTRKMSASLSCLHGVGHGIMFLVLHKYVGAPWDPADACTPTRYGGRVSYENRRAVLKEAEELCNLGPKGGYLPATAAGMYEEYFTTVELSYDHKQKQEPSATDVMKEVLQICRTATLSEVTCLYYGILWNFFPKVSMVEPILPDFQELYQVCLQLTDVLQKRRCFSGVSYTHLYLRWMKDLVQLPADAAQGPMRGFVAFANLFGSPTATNPEPFGVEGFCGASMLDQDASTELFKGCVYGLIYNIAYLDASNSFVASYFLKLCDAINVVESSSHKWGFSTSIEDVCRQSVREHMTPIVSLEHAASPHGAVARIADI